FYQKCEKKIVRRVLRSVVATKKNICSTCFGDEFKRASPGRKPAS
ncbi:MAG: hypothetical protein ACI8S3_000610, partial [Alphaproteobacteria bacterium]